MKLLIASDIHGAADCCRSLLDAWDREGADRLLLLGDILYHGPRCGRAFSRLFGALSAFAGAPLFIFLAKSLFSGYNSIRGELR